MSKNKSETGKLIPIKVKVSEIIVKEFRIVDLPKEFTNTIDENQLRFGYSVKFPKTNKGFFGIDLIVSYQYPIEGKMIDLLSLTCSTIFLIESKNKSVVTYEGESTQINDKLLASLLSMSYGTLRGIIFEKTRGTFLNKYYIPSIMADQLFKNAKQNNQL